MELHNGRRRQQDPALYIGVCFTDDIEIAEGYGEIVTTIEMPKGLEVLEVEVSREDIDNNDWPGDTEEGCAAFAADGVDVVRFEDMDENGVGHTTWRLVSQRAVDAAR